jgi:hypothetical protein
MNAELSFRAAQARVAAMAAQARSDAIWLGMRRLAEADASSLAVVAYFALCARLRTEGITRASLIEVAAAVGRSPDQICDLLVELVERRAVLVRNVDEQGIVVAVPVFDGDRASPSAALH